ncbi:lysine--tRNA ligase [Candidatus Gracilibacteria bacterium]|nr:lysine--tRNA ligase [Candidatus Gracilibacteria bacterium]
MSPNTPNSPIDIGPLQDERIGKIHDLEGLGIICFPERFERNSDTQTIQNIDNLPQRDVSALFAEDKESYETVSLAGRLMGYRTHGKIAFGDLQDRSGRIQLAFAENAFTIETGRGEEKMEFASESETVSSFAFVKKYIDLGDIIGVRGIPFITKRGEKSILVSNFQLLTKSINPLPDKHEGLKDIEMRYRKRYLDMLNPEIQRLMERRSKFFSSMRRYLEDLNFMELDTPTLENTTGGADARPFMTHYNAYDRDVFLRISAGELWQKRLMVAGFEKTFEIGKIFRNEGVSPEHAQDYMQMEVYWAYADYNDMMRLVRDMYLHVIDATYGKREFFINGHTVDFSTDWQILDYQTLIKERTGIDIFTSTEEEIIARLRELGAHYEAGNRPRLVDYLWKYIRKSIAGPAFLINEPKFTSPLAKSDINNPHITHRFHVILAGSEVGNGYSELNDPIDQLERFESQQALRDAGDDEAQMADYDFVEALMHGMPPTAGFGVSERLFAFLEGKPIKECQPFPYVKPRN